MLSRRDLLIASASLPTLTTRPIRSTAQLGRLSRLREMLAFVPVPEAMPDGGGSGQQLFSYADVGAVMMSIGRSSFPATDEIGGEEFIRATQKIPLDSPIYPYAKTDWRRLVGFGPQDVKVLLTAFEPPHRVRVYAGEFDSGLIRAALTEQGYVEKEEGDFALLTGPNGDGYDLKSEIDAAALGAFNYVLVADELVITTHERAVMDAVLDAVKSGDSLRKWLDEESDLLPLLDPLSGIFLFNGAVLSRFAPGEAGMAPEPALPPAQLFAGGITLTEAEASAGFMVEFLDPVDEEVVETIKTRLDEGLSVVSRTPLTEVLGPVEVAQVPDTEIVQVLGESEEIQMRWLRMIVALDLNFIATE